LVWVNIFLKSGELRTYTFDTMIEAMKFASENYHDKASSMNFIWMDKRKGVIPDGRKTNVHTEDH
jgi:hypothetical protein